MARHFDLQIENLKSKVVQLGERVEGSVEAAMRAVESLDGELARQVIAADQTIDRLEVDVEEDCLHALALYQPVASDLRFIVSLVKINNDLERIGDLAVGLAEETLFLIDESHDERELYSLVETGHRVRAMVHQSLASLAGAEVGLAEEVCQADAKIDALHRTMYQQVKQDLREHPDHAERQIDLLCISRQLERIADHAVNIAEDVIYSVSGEIRRHQPVIDPTLPLGE